MRRIKALALAAVLAITSLGSFGAGHAGAWYWNGCAGQENNFHAYLWRATPGTIMDATARIPNLKATHACTGTQGISWVLPINLQLANGNNATFVQFGYGNSSYYPDPPHWWWTPDDASGGLMQIPLYWPDPIVGHTYTLRVYAVGVCSVGLYCWRYMAHDDTAGGDWLSMYGKRRGGPGTYPQFFWSGFEVYNLFDQFGGAGTGQYVDNIGYDYYTPPNYQYFVPSITSYGTCCAGDIQAPNWRVLRGTDGNGRNWISGYTVDTP